MGDYSIFLWVCFCGGFFLFNSRRVILLEHNKQWDHNPYKTRGKSKSLLVQIKMTQNDTHFLQVLLLQKWSLLFFPPCAIIFSFRKFQSECKLGANHENCWTNLIWSNIVLKCFTKCHWNFMCSNSAGFKSSLFTELLLNKMVKSLETHGHPQLRILVL